MAGEPTKDPDLLKEAVEFWSSTSTDWADPGHSGRGTALAGVDRTELQAMIARKRHNDAVRLAELNLLRRIRQEGLTGEQIREVEQARKSADSGQPSDFAGGSNARGAGMATPSRLRQSQRQDENAVTVMLPPREAGHADSKRAEALAALPSRSDELDEVKHDTELDQAAIAFANADFGGCESTLRDLISPGGSRHRHAPTWRALLDLYRATGQESDFDRLALTYTRDLAQSPPQWVSIPRLAMNIAGRPQKPRNASGSAGSGAQASSRTSPAWQCPTLLDGAAISSMQAFRRAAQGVPVIDWTSAKVLTNEGAQGLLELLQACADAPERLAWKGTKALLGLLQDTPRAEGRPEDEVLWHLRLAILRLSGVQGLYDLVAMDFSAAYGKPAAVWVPAVARIVETEEWESPVLTAAGDFSVATVYGRQRGAPDITVELVGQLTGDINDTLGKTLSDVQASRSVRLSCARLIRVDLMAAGELMNWVGARKAEGRQVRFIEVHRLLALFFCAMGLNDHATIELRPL